MTKKDYSDPKTVQIIIEQCRRLQENFNSQINLNYLEEAVEILDKAIENTPEDDPSRQKFIYERNRLHNRYPDLEKWLSGPRYDYHVDIKYEYRKEYKWDEDEDYSEKVDRNIILKYINEFNQKKDRNIQEFFKNHKKIFIDQFHYAMTGFEGKKYYQGFWDKGYSQDWVGILLKSMGFPKWGEDESFIIRNAPPFDEDSKVYLPVRPNFLDDDKNTSSVEHDVDKADFYYLPIDIRFYDWNEELHSSTGYFGLSSQLISKIIKTRNLLKTKEANDLDIKSVNFLMDFIYIRDEVYKKLIIDEETIYGWKDRYERMSDVKIIRNEQIPAKEWEKLRFLRGGHQENIFGNIEITKEGFLNGEWVTLQDSVVSLKLFYNNNNPRLNSFDWEMINSGYYYEFLYKLPMDDFLAMFPIIEKDDK